MLKYLFLSLVVLGSLQLNAQLDVIGYGFRAGISISKIDGVSELGPNNEELESNKMSSGFHIGMSFNFKFTDIMGIRTELLYSQRGTQYLYDGPSYYMLGRNTLQPLTLTGHRRQTLDVSNSYLDIPLMAYYKLGSVEISGGFNAGILISSTAGGSLEFDGVSPLSGNQLDPFEINLNYNYKSDDAGFASETTRDFGVDGRTYALPEFAGAYYEFPEKDGSLYKTLDFGLAAGVSYFLNEGLFLGIKYIHGLGDVDRNEYDVSLQSLDSDGNPIPRADVNKSKSLQFSVGFTF